MANTTGNEMYMMDIPKKPFKKKTKGQKVEKKKDKEWKKNKTKLDMDPEVAKQRNPKAFGSSTPVGAKKQRQRIMDNLHKREHLPLPNRIEVVGVESAPIIVAIQGPPKVGKTTLLKCLIQHYTKQRVKDIQGPLTLIAGKRRRLTFIEVPNDINAMADISKIADLVLLLVDLKFGFEMETFEFLNMLQTHGFPKVIGVLTHMDQFRQGTLLSDTKRTLKKRFKEEIDQSTKLFNLSGFINDQYLERDITNLAKFISVAKFRPLIWRNSHSYVLVDRIEDITDPEKKRQNKKADRTVAFFGYVHGIPLKKNVKIHIPGCGDFNMESVSTLNDPCPFPTKRSDRQRLNYRDKLIYAPTSNIGHMYYDKDAIYIDIDKKDVRFSDVTDLVGSAADKEMIANKREGQGEKMVKELKNLTTTIDESLNNVDLVLLPGSNTAVNIEDTIPNQEEARVRRPAPSKLMLRKQDGQQDASIPEEDEDSIDEDENGADEDGANEDGANEDGADEDEEDEQMQTSNETPRRRKSSLNISENDNGQVEFESEESGEEYEEINNKSKSKNYDDDRMEASNNDNNMETFDDGQFSTELKWKEKMLNSAKTNFIKPVDLMKLVYGKKNESEQPNKLDDDDDDFFKPKSQIKKNNKNEDESSRFKLDQDEILDLDNEEIKNILKSRFVKEGYFSDKKNAVSSADFEDLEKKKEGNDEDESEDEDNGEDEDEQKRLDKKLSLKEKFDAEYDVRDDIEKEENVGKSKKGGLSELYEQEGYFADLKTQLEIQKKINKETFAHLPLEERIALEGHAAGHYVRIEIHGIPSEFIDYNDLRYPVMIGSLSPQEENISAVQVRIKKHRWHKKILKTNDPLIISAGWRRFQTQPAYAVKDPNDRIRRIKYTPPHSHCLAVFYGPVLPPGTGLVAFQYLSNRTNEFRISATGVVLELSQHFQIMKKLKLVGVPYKVEGKTAFIKDLFNSSMEVAKFIGASVRTVSSIRGIIKKPQKDIEGAFRATFEDRILMSDLVFLRTWVPVELSKYYNPVADMLMHKSKEWKGMKTVFQLRKELNLSIPKKSDSMYKKINRKELTYDDQVKISKNLMKKLPYSMVPQAQSRKRKAEVLDGPDTIILEQYEKDRLSMLEELDKLNAKREKAEVVSKQRKEDKLKELARKEEEIKRRIGADKKKELYRLKDLLDRDLKRPTKRRKIFK